MTTTKDSASNEGKVAIVTGSSRGIGASIARRLASEGFTVIVNYAGRAADADAVVAAIRAAGGRAEAIQADVSAPAQVAALFDQAATLFGGVDVLVNNAGVIQPGLMPLSETDDALFEKIVGVNLKGTFNTLRVAAKKLCQGGRIVNFSSCVRALGIRCHEIGGRDADPHIRQGTSGTQHHRQCRRTGTDRDGPLSDRQDPGANRSPSQNAADGAAGNTGRYRRDCVVPCRPRRRLDRRPDATRQWRHRLNQRNAY
jgi:hypothetical protein